jgi:maleylacetoacetate isomerase
MSMAPDLTLHGFFNSSASFRVRIALELKGLAWRHAGVNLRKGDQDAPEFRQLNPSGLVPALEIDGRRLSQSLAIIDLLDRLAPEPRLLPTDGSHREQVLEIACLIAADIHPLDNLRVLKYLTSNLAVTDAQKQAWYAHWIHEGFRALERLLPDHDGWCVGSSPTLADCCLVPQVANASRMAVDLDAYPRIRRVARYCNSHPAFQRAAPSAQPDYVAA